MSNTKTVQSFRQILRGFTKSKKKHMLKISAVYLIAIQDWQISIYEVLHTNLCETLNCNQLTSHCFGIPQHATSCPRSYWAWHWISRVKKIGRNRNISLCQKLGIENLDFETKPFQCKICECKFTEKSKLSRHLTILKYIKYK